MNTIRMIAIALPMMLLLACGGGGGGNASPTAMMPGPNVPGTDDPMIPPTVTLPGYAFTAATARTHVGGTAPASMTEAQIVAGIQTRATAADTFEFSDFVGAPDVDITCTNNSSCSGTVPNVGTLTFSLAGIEDLSLVDDMNLVRFDSETEAVMVDEGVTMIQSQSAAGQSDGTRLSFQTYGGWLANSVFGVEVLRVIEDGTTTNRFASFSIGNDNGSNPTGSAFLRWIGIMVGTDTQTGDIIHGDATVEYQTANPNNLDQITFSNAINLNNGNRVVFGNFSEMQFQDIPLTNGSFESASGDIKGSFYGTSHGEVGGIFNHSTYNIIGAFGGTR